MSNDGQPNGYDKRLRDLENWSSGQAVWGPNIETRLTVLEAEMKASNRTISRWAGAFLVIQIIATMVGAALAKSFLN